MDTVLEVAGIVCLIVAGFLFHVVVGFVVAGGCLIILGVALEARRRDAAPSEGGD